MTFDNVPWICTMKKNDHYFPTTEWIKDPQEECGWRRVTYEYGKVVRGEGSEGINSAEENTYEEDGGTDVEPVKI